MTKIENYLNCFYDKFFNYREMNDLLMTENMSFVLSDINRLQSTLLCEAGLSYVQQSQRYVPVNKKFIKFLDNTPEELVKEDIEALEDMIIIAINDAIKQINKETEEKMGAYTKGMPGLF